MTHRVVFTQQASREMSEAADWWAEHRDRAQAARWYADFSDQIWTLCQDPERFPFSAENDGFPYTIREIHYGLSSRPTHRAVYTIVGDIVLVLTIRHAAQDRISADDIETPNP